MDPVVRSVRQLGDLVNLYAVRLTDGTLTVIAADRHRDDGAMVHFEVRRGGIGQDAGWEPVSVLRTVDVAAVEPVAPSAQR